MLGGISEGYSLHGIPNLWSYFTGRRRGATRYFYLDTNRDGRLTNITTERFGPFPNSNDPPDRPVAGDWDGDGIDEIGLYCPSKRKYILRSSNEDNNHNAAVTAIQQLRRNWDYEKR